MQMRAIVLVFSCSAWSVTLVAPVSRSVPPQAQEKRAADAKQSSSGADADVKKMTTTSKIARDPEADVDQKNAKLTAIGQTEATLAQLQASAPIGRVVMHISPDMKSWQNTAADVAVRDGDVLFVPKKAGYVMVNGQVFNPTAVSFRPGRSAKWYLSQAGGVTQMADKKAVFVIRADGSVIAAKNNSAGWWGGDPMSVTLRAGDVIVVPEKAPKIGGRNWALIMQSAQMASSVALAVAYIHP